MESNTKGSLSPKPRFWAHALSRAARISRSLYAASVFAACALTATPALAQNPMEESAARSIGYMDCVIRTEATTIDAAVVALVEKCHYKLDQPVADTIAELSAVLPLDDTAPLAEQLAPIKDRFTDEQFEYFVELDAILDAAVSTDELGASLAKLEERALKSLGRSKEDLKVLEGISFARYSVELLSGYKETEAVFQDKGCCRFLRGVVRVVRAVIAGVESGGPVGGIVAGVKAIAREIIRPG